MTGHFKLPQPEQEEIGLNMLSLIKLKQSNRKQNYTHNTPTCLENKITHTLTCLENKITHTPLLVTTDKQGPRGCPHRKLINTLWSSPHIHLTTVEVFIQMQSGSILNGLFAIPELFKFTQRYQRIQ